MFRLTRRRNGQVFLEYTIIIGVIVMVLMAMNMTIKRGIQGMVKVVADQVGNQEGSDQKVEEEGGYLVAAYTTTRVSTDTVKEEFLGSQMETYADVVDTISNTVSNLGLSE